MKRSQISIRDPFILLDKDTYYLYGTRSQTAWTDGTGFDVYVSKDLENWEGPKVIYEKTKDFWADKEYWAPECIKYNDRFYLFATLGSHTKKKGVQVFVSDKPDGNFEPLSQHTLTPEDWNCLDATIYMEGDKKYMVFSHSLPEEPKGAIMYVELSEDMKEMVSTPETLFYTKDAPWTRPIPFAKEEFGLDGDNYFSDGPYLFYNDKNELCMLWSSWSEKGYAMGVSVSDSGHIEGPWIHQEMPRYFGGGHGMVFADKGGSRFVLWHSPNDFSKERPYFISLEEFMK